MRLPGTRKPQTVAQAEAQEAEAAVARLDRDIEQAAAAVASVEARRSEVIAACAAAYRGEMPLGETERLAADAENAARDATARHDLLASTRPVLASALEAARAALEDIRRAEAISPSQAREILGWVRRQAETGAVGWGQIEGQVAPSLVAEAREVFTQAAAKVATDRAAHATAKRFAFPRISPVPGPAGSSAHLHRRQ